MTGSLAYRTHHKAIWDGQPPEKYRRLLPFIDGLRILEVGAAEGVLSLMLADREPSAQIIGVEARSDRYEAALALQERWAAIGRRVSGCVFRCGDFCSSLELLQGVDTFVAIRTLYHLHESIDHVLSAVAAARVSSVVLGGNANRARRGIAGDPFDWYAGADGMREALERAGYRIDRTVTEGDPIVTGHR